MADLTDIDEPIPAALVLGATIAPAPSSRSLRPSAAGESAGIGVAAVPVS